MAISSATSRNDYTGNGAVDTYAYSFKIFLESDLLVKVRDTDGAETTLTLTTHYTVTGEGNEGGGNVALVNGAFAWLDGDGDLKTGYTLSILRRRPLTQTADFRNQGEFYGSTHEDTFDHLVMIDQQQQDQLDRCFRLPDTIDPDNFSAELPGDLEDSPGYVLAVNDDGDGFTLIQVPDLDSVINLDLGSSGNAGSLDIFPATAARGRMRFTAANSVGDTVTEIVNASQAAARTYTIPDAGASASFVMTAGAQTIAGVKTFSSQPLFSAGMASLALTATSNQLVLGTTNTTTLSATAPSASRVYTMPDVGGAADFVMTLGTQTIGGAKTFSSNLNVNIGASSTVIITSSNDSGGVNIVNNTRNWFIGGLGDASLTFRDNTGTANRFQINTTGQLICVNGGTTSLPGYTFNANTAAGMGWNGSVFFAVPTNIDYNFYYNGGQMLNISGSANQINSYQTTKTVDLGISSNAWDDVYADDFQNVADIEMLDWKKDMKTGEVQTLNDLDIIKAIKPKRDSKGDLVFNAKGHAFWDDDTLPRWMFTENKKDPGNLVLDPEGRPWVSLRMLSALSLGAIGQLIARVEELEKKLVA